MDWKGFDSYREKSRESIYNKKKRKSNRFASLIENGWFVFRPDYICSPKRDRINWLMATSLLLFFSKNFWFSFHIIVSWFYCTLSASVFNQIEYNNFFPGSFILNIKKYIKNIYLYSNGTGSLKNYYVHFALVMVMDWCMSVVWFSIVDWCSYFMDDWCSNSGHFVNEWFTVDNSIETIVIISGVFDCAFMT